MNDFHQVVTIESILFTITLGILNNITDGKNNITRNNNITLLLLLIVIVVVVIVVVVLVMAVVVTVEVGAIQQ